MRQIERRQLDSEGAEPVDEQIEATAFARDSQDVLSGAGVALDGRESMVAQLL